jgi:hypothetical protein
VFDFDKFGCHIIIYYLIESLKYQNIVNQFWDFLFSSNTKYDNYSLQYDTKHLNQKK